MYNLRAYSIFFLLLLIGNICFASTIQLQWDPSTDSRLAGYKVYYRADTTLTYQVQFHCGEGEFLNCGIVTVENATESTIKGLDPAREYFFAVTAYSTEGEESVFSNIIKVPELIPPMVSIQSPASNEHVSGTVSVAVNAVDKVGVTKVEFYLNDSLISSSSLSPFIFSWDTRAIAAGTYTLMARAYDVAGNMGQSAPVSVIARGDTVPPVIRFTSPMDGQVVKGVVSVQANVSDDNSIKLVELSLNGGPIFVGNAPPYSTVWNTAEMVDGQYVLSAKASDNAGNEASGRINVIVQNAAPVAIAPVMLDGNPPRFFYSLQEACSVATDPVAKIFARDVDFFEDVIIDLSKTYHIEGGTDNQFNPTPDGHTTIKSLKIRKGKVIVNGVKIR